VITQIWFARSYDNRPQLRMRSVEGGVMSYDIAEELYDQWVPDTNHLHGESLSEGISWEKPLVPNLKTS
jgi:hypothetical protein